MTPRQTFSFATQLAGLALVAAGLAWLIFGVAGNRSGMRAFPDADGSKVEILSEGDARTVFADVLATPSAGWQRWDGRGYVRPEHGDVLWLKVTLRHGGAKAVEGVLQDTGYFPDHVTAWIEDDADGWMLFEGGEAEPAAGKPLPGRTSAFPVRVPPGAGLTVYLRTTDYFEVYLQPRWWPRASDFFAAQLRDTLAEAICFGGLAALIIYNAILWVRLRFSETGYYVVYAGATAVFNFASNGGLAMFGLSVGSPWKEMILAGSLAVSGLFLMQFARLFLQTKKEMPRMDRVLAALRVLFVLLLAGTAGMPWERGLLWLNLAVAMMGLTHLLLLLAAVAAWRAGVARARFFVAAFGVFFSGLIPVMVMWINQDIAAWAAMCLLGGSTLEMLLLSFAVADRFARIQRERVETQERLVEEIEQRRAIQEAYADELEIEVRERTRELVEANEDKDRMIAVIGHDLRSPLTALTRTAEQLATGVTAVAAQTRFIGDAAQMGRQVLLLIEDLVLWARLRAGTKHLVAQSVAGLVLPVLELYRPLAERRQVELLMMDVPADLKVTTDLVLAQTLVRNLVANALRYARARVHVSAVPVPGGVKVLVRDDGPGLPPLVAARLAPEAAAPDWAGNGLGLRLCVEIGRALGASLRTGPGEWGGTEFSFMLPASPDKAGEVTKL